MLLMLAMPFNVAKSKYDPVFTALSAFEGIVPTKMRPINEKKGNRLISLPEDPLERFIAIATFIHLTRLVAARSGINSIAGPPVDVTRLHERVKEWFGVPRFLEKDIQPFVDAHYRLFRKILAKIPNARELIVRILEHEDYKAARELARKIKELADDPEIKYSQERYMIFKIAKKFGIEHKWVTELLSELEEYFKKRESEALVKKAVMDVMLGVGVKGRPVLPKIGGWGGLRGLLEGYEEELGRLGFHDARLIVGMVRGCIERRGGLSMEDVEWLAEGAGALRRVYEFVRVSPWFLEGLLGGGDPRKYVEHLRKRVSYLEVPDEFREVAEKAAESLIREALTKKAGAAEPQNLLDDLLRKAGARADYWARIESELRKHAKEKELKPHRIAETLAELAPGAWNKAIEKRLAVK